MEAIFANKGGECDRTFLNVDVSNHLSRQAGASVIEYVLGLVMAVVAIIAVFTLFTGGMSSTKVQAETTYMQQIAGEVQQMYATNRDYGTGDLTATLITIKAAPAPMIVGSTLRNSWGGTVTVTGASDTFVIATTAIPKKECIKLAQIAINPTAVTINGAAQTLPLTGASTATACSGATNSISWNIR